MDIEPTMSAQRNAGDGETAYVKDVYSLEDVCEALDMRPSEVRATAADELAELLGYDPRGYDGGPGRWFWSGARATVKRHRVVVGDYGGLDI